MSRKKRTRGASRAAQRLAPTEEENKPNVQLPPIFVQPFSRIHRAELNVLLDEKSVDLSIAFCHQWAIERGVDPAFVVDWVRRRSVGESRRISGAPARRAGEDGVEVLDALPDFDNIRVKRERAASPVLSGGRPAKKSKATEPHSSCGTLPKSTAVPAQAVRHTRAHDGNPHPGCPGCTQSTFALPATSGSTLDIVTPAGPVRTPLSVGLVSRPALKSALRTSTGFGTSARAPRRVRFSHELYAEALAAYTHLRTSQDASSNVRKRDRSVLDISEESTLAKDSDLSLAATGNRLPLSTTSFPSAAGHSVGSPNSMLDAAESTSPSSKRIKLSPSTVLYTPLPPPCLAVSPDSDSGVSSGSSMTKNSASSVTSRERLLPGPSVVPRTPSPQRGSASRPISFFSPSFFSPSGSSSSGEDEVEALLTSSPPTSPLLVPCSLSPCSIISPSPNCQFSSSVLETLERQITPEPIHHVDSVLTGIRSPSSQLLPPPADIPPRPRTPPNSGPGPGSKPCAPQPNRPPRPTAEAHGPAARLAQAEVVVVEGGQQRPFPPRARSPPCPPGGGSRQCTPEPGRPPRPSADEVPSCAHGAGTVHDVDVTMLAREEEEELPKYEEEEDELASIVIASMQPQGLPPRSRSPCGGRPLSRPYTPELVRLLGSAAVVSSSHCTIRLDAGQAVTAPSPADIPPRARTPPGGHPPGSRQCSPQPVRPVRPSACSAVEVDICAPHPPQKIDVHVLPFPPRARTPPGPPGTGSRPCTPEPSRPVRPTEGGVLGEEGYVEAALAKGASTTGALEGASARMASKMAASVVKVEESLTECVAVWRAGEKLFLSADEDDEPLAIVLARRKAVIAEEVGNKPAAAVRKDAKHAKTRGKQAVPAKAKGKAAVKIEESGVILGEVPAAATIKKKRTSKPKGGPQTDTAEVKSEEIATSTTVVASAIKKPRKKRIAKDAAGVDESANTNTESDKGKKTRKRGTKAGAKAAAATTSAPQVSTASTSAGIQVRVSLSRTSSLQKRESYKGNKHPPRTFTYAPEHMHALAGTSLWDAEGFDCMELSALPWLAGHAQHIRTEDDEWSVDSTGTAIVTGQCNATTGEYEIIFAPEVPEHVLMDEEDVRLRLYAQGPLPASFLTALGRAVSIRRDEQNSQAEDVGTGEIGAAGRCMNAVKGGCDV